MPINACSSLFILLFIGSYLPVIGQDKPPVAGRQQPLLPTVERHQNPEYNGPDVKPAASRRKPKRLKRSGEYAIPFGSNPDSTLTRLTESGMHVRISPDGKWLIISQPNGAIDSREPLYRHGLF